MNGSSLAPLSPGSSFADVGSRLSDQDKVFREGSDNATRLRSAWETQKRWINIFYTLVPSASNFFPLQYFRHKHPGSGYSKFISNRRGGGRRPGSSDAEGRMEKKGREKADRKRKTRWPGSKFSTLWKRRMHCIVFLKKDSARMTRTWRLKSAASATGEG